MENYRYTQTWFLGSEVRRKLLQFVNTTKKNSVLEIGCFEGLSSVFWADNILDHEDSTLTCVDPYLTINSNDHKQFLYNNEEANFDHNVKVCKNSHKVTVRKVTSDEFFKTNTCKFNFIYIDGCHECPFITKDMENSFASLENDGIMWMDDYLGGAGGQIKSTMDCFLTKYDGHYEIINCGYQLAIRKIRPHRAMMVSNSFKPVVLPAD